MQSEYFDFNNQNSQFQGRLNKWTNYVLGWKTRFFVLSRGSLLYYKSEEDRQFGCRGAINLSDAVVVAHDLDECRFDVYISDLTWYLRSESSNERRKWLDELKLFTKHTIVDSQLPEWQNSYLTLREKKRLIVSYRDILCKQLHNIEDVLTSQVEAEHENVVVDWKDQLVTFKQTAALILNGISDCIGVLGEKRLIMGSPEEQVKFEIVPDECSKELTPAKESELFYDAVEGLESLAKPAEGTSQNGASEPLIADHKLWSEITAVTDEHIRATSTDRVDGLWSLLVEGDNMKIYTRELEVDGLVVDPLKACCTVKGVTGHEMCHYFFHPQYRKDWENSLESVEVVEQIDSSALIMYQIYKRLWPTAQRDLLFWSHLTHREDPTRKEGPNIWCVVNKSVDLPEFPINEGRLVRVDLSACLYCVTEVSQGLDSSPTRENLTCHLTYCSAVNPGGWVPASAVRALRRKEYPKFLTNFTSYVQEQTRNKDILM